MKFEVLLILGLILIAGFQWHTRMICYDGSIWVFPFNNDPERTQVGISNGGYPITCDGVVHEDAGCSFLFSGLCKANHVGEISRSYMNPQTAAAAQESNSSSKGGIRR
jgi:hypothetical protein